MNKLLTADDTDRFTRALVPTDQAFRASEAKWGIGRLERLVSTPTLAAYHRGWTAYRKALDEGDGPAIEAIGPRMVAALAFMDGEATRAGHGPLACETWEAPLADGSVLVVVRTLAEAHAVTRAVQAAAGGKPESGLPPDLMLAVRHQHEGRALAVWTMAEIAALVSARAVPINAVKAAFPGAEVTGAAWEGTSAPSAVQRHEYAAADHVRSGWPLDQALV